MNFFYKTLLSTIFVSSTCSQAEVWYSINDIYLDINKNSKVLDRIPLVVFDIDNTLIKSRQDLGSDLWYNWQKKTKSDIFKLNEECLYNVAIPLLTTFNEYEPVEKYTVDDFNRIKSKFDTIAITSRNPNLRITTERALNNNNIYFDNKKFDESINNKKLDYAGGIFMTGGGDKGEVLRSLLELNPKYKEVYFIDDGSKNIEDMKNAFSKDSKVKIYTYHYAKVEYDFMGSTEKYSYAKYEKLNGNLLNQSWKDFSNYYATVDQNEVCKIKTNDKDVK